MFIKSIQLKNFKLFSPAEFFEISDLNIPDGQRKGIYRVVGGRKDFTPNRFKHSS